MLDKAATIVVLLLGIHILVKFAFFALPYAKRRAALDRSYGDKPTATALADTVSLAIVIALSAMILSRWSEPVSFLGGLWIGGTLIQIYFHRFHAPLRHEQEPPPEASPIKTMSYAIQAAPWRPWREILVLTILVIVSLFLIVEQLTRPA